TARPIVDSNGTVCAVYGGMPDDDDFMLTVHDPAVAAMEDARAKASLNNEACHHRRGDYAQLSGGDSFGGGQTQPGALQNGVINAAIFQSLILLPAFQQLAGFGSGE
ncbi:hypothetical protein B0H12DRAFT_965733, partial [Mycena haematopus]